MRKIFKKNQKKKGTKGFTLVELLAVLTILATILLLVVPTVLSVIKKSETTVDQESITRYGRAIKQSILEYQLDHNENVSGFYEYRADNDKYITNVENNDVEIKLTYEGNKVTCGVILADIYGEVYLDDCKINDKSVEYTYGNSEDFFYYLYEPDLYNDSLVPVYYDGNDWIVTNSVSSDWYDYKKQKWANAVILANGVEKKEGDTVSVTGSNPDVIAMFVWIPRYEYKIEGTYGKNGLSSSSPGEIEVNFIAANKKEASDGYIIHPAFTFGDTDLSGIWVGKFEVSHTTKTTTSMECTDEECAEGANLRILPDKVSLRNNNVSSFFYAIRSMNSYWFNYNDTNSHMIKNDEWGAVAYLAQSKYGKYGNDDYEGVSTEVYINNSSGFYTGRSGGSYGGNTAINTVYTNQTSTTQYNTYGFYTYDGYLLSYDTNTKTDTRNMLKIASTTGNITGVYDMSGGLWEFVMGMFANSDGVKWAGYNQTHNSGFEGNAGTTPTNITGLGWPNKKYYNVYKAYSETNISSTTACDSKICYGHALSETSNWYGDYSNFVSISAPWFDRGGGSTIGKAAGLFSFDSYWGHANGRNSTRVVLTSN